MAYLVRHEDLDEGPTSLVERLFVEVWMNVLQSRTSMLLGPPPFSVLSLLESIRHALAEGSLRPSTIAYQLAIALDVLQRRAWIRSAYPDWHRLEAALTKALAAIAEAKAKAKAKAKTKARIKRATSFKAVVSCVNELLNYFSRTRVSSHVDFILELRDDQLPLVIDEVTDLLADLIAIGHSESFLFGWGGAVLLAEKASRPRPPLADRFQRLHDLGQDRCFLVCFKVMTRGSSPIPGSDRLSVGRAVDDDFTDREPWTYNPGETGVSVEVSAPDYKAAVEEAMGTFARHIRSLTYDPKLQRVRPIADVFKIKCQDDGKELLIEAAAVKPYEPPPLIYGNATWRCRDTSPKVVPPLEQTLSWLDASRNLQGEAEFITLWLAQVSLFGTDNVASIVPQLARYRTTILAQLLAEWIGDYLGKALKFNRPAVPYPLAEQLMLRGKPEERLAPIVRAVRDKPNAFQSVTSQSPLLERRISELAGLCYPQERNLMVEQTEATLRTLLPWVRSIRNGVAHLSAASTTSLDLANQHLIEDVTLVYDAVTASALGQRATSIEEIHTATVNDFDALMESLLTEPCLSPLHIREGRRHTKPLPRRKGWPRLS